MEIIAYARETISKAVDARLCPLNVIEILVNIRLLFTAARTISFLWSVMLWWQKIPPECDSVKKYDMLGVAQFCFELVTLFPVHKRSSALEGSAQR